jgi:pimeloyl-ACP methyl ester carboxylesterase
MLACTSWGEGRDIVLLLHGMAGSSRSWWQVGPALADLGYRVLAVDLPGHGRSEPDSAATPESFEDELVRSVPDSVRLAIGHSMGGSVLAGAVARGLINADGAVYVEAPFATPALDVGREDLRSRYARLKASRTERWYRENRPMMVDGDIEAEVAASHAWDVDTATSLSWHAAGRTIDLRPKAPSLIVRADPSDAVGGRAAAQLEQRGFTVRSMAGAGHTVWHGRVPEFVTLIDEWVVDQSGRSG